MSKLTPTEWSRFEEVLDHALELPPEDRASFVDRICGPDDLLRRKARALVEAAERAGDFLERPVDACAPGLLREIAEAAEEEAEGDAARGGSLAGGKLGPYRLLQELGRGGMGAVYLAERDDRQYDRRVAVKVLPAGLLNRDLRTRFLLERRILASLEHPNIARLYDAGVAEDGTPYFVMECVEGHRIDIHCELHGLWNLPAAMKIARALEPLEPYWFEDPIRPSNVDALKRFRDSTRIWTTVWSMPPP